MAAPAALARDQTAAAEFEVVAFGDSLSAGYGVGPGEAFPERLEAALRDTGYAARVINAGVSGDTTSSGLARVDWSVPETADLVIVELGANDALRGISPALTEKNLGEILSRLAKREGRVLLAGMMAPPNMGAEFSAEFDSLFRRLAEKHDVSLYPFFLEGVAAEPALNQDDGMHPNADGVDVIVERILPAVTRELDALRSRAGTN